MSDAPLQEVEFCDVCNSLMDPNKLMGIFAVYKLVYKLVYLLVNECFKLFCFTIPCVGAKDCGNNVVLYNN